MMMFSVIWIFQLGDPLCEILVHWRSYDVGFSKRYSFKSLIDDFAYFAAVFFHDWSWFKKFIR